jgi:integrase
MADAPKLPKHIFLRGGVLWMSLRRGPDDWPTQTTGITIAEDPRGKAAAEFRRKVQERLDAGQDFATETGKAPTIHSFGEKWVQKRQKLNVKSWDDDASRLKTHIYPVLGTMQLDVVRPRHVNQVVENVRMLKRAPRTVRNVYAVMQALFRDAEIDGLIDKTPCILTKYQLGVVRDADPDWRRTAIYTLDEVVGLCTDPRVPQDRRVMYALLFLSQERHGEAAGARWRHYDATLKPLGRLVCSTSYDDATTKTGVERWIPVHPTLAAILAEWKLSGWPREFGRKPNGDDLIVPHTRPTNRGPRVEFGGMRSDHDTYKRMRKDCDALGFRRRRTHDTRRTGITLLREAGADKDIVRTWTHKPSRDVIDQYTSFGWEKMCDEMMKLKVRRPKRLAR